MANFDASRLLDAAQQGLSVKTDYKLSQVTGISKACISNYRLGKALPDAKSCKILADAAGIDADILIVQIEAARAKDDAAAALWSRIAYRLERSGALAGTAIFALVFASLLIAGLPDLSMAGEAQTLSFSDVTNLYIVLSSVVLFTFEFWVFAHRCGPLNFVPE